MPTTCLGGSVLGGAVAPVGQVFRRKVLFGSNHPGLAGVNFRFCRRPVLALPLRP